MSFNETYSVVALNIWKEEIILTKKEIHRCP